MKDSLLLEIEKFDLNEQKIRFYRNRNYIKIFSIDSLATSFLRENI